MKIAAVIISLLLSASLASGDEIRIDHRTGTTGNYSPVRLTTTTGHVLTFDAGGVPIIAAAPAAGSIATDTLWDAAGDLAVGSGADTSTRLARGTALQVLRVNAAGTALEWAAASGGGGGIAAGDSPTWTEAHTFSKAGAASTPTISLTGLPFTGGSATTTKPLLLLEPTGTTSTGWSTTGTMLGVNAASGFAGNLIDAQVAGSSKFKVTSDGYAIVGNYDGLLYAGSIIASTQFLVTGGGRLLFPSDGVARFVNYAQTSFSGIQFGGADLSLTRLGPNNFRQGALSSATPLAQTFTIGEASRPGTDSNVGGANGTIQSGLGTGTGTASSLIFQTPTVAGAGSGVQTYATRLTLNAAGAAFTGNVTAAASTTWDLSAANVLLGAATGLPVEFCVAMSDETTAITTGTAKVTMRSPYAFTLTGVRASVNTVSSSGLPTVDINEGAGAGTTVLSTKLTIDASEFTSVTAATAAVISDSAIADDAQLTFDIDVSGTGAKGLKVWVYGNR